MQEKVKKNFNQNNYRIDLVIKILKICFFIYKKIRNKK